MTTKQITQDAPVRVIRERRPRAPQITLTVTPEIIDNALPSDSGHCVWADALKAAVPNAQRISVDLQTMRYSDPVKGCRYTYLTPRVAQVDLVNWDLGVKPEPKSIRLRGAMVTKMGTSSRLRANSGSLPKTQELVDRNKTQGTVPDRVGGQTPPIAAFSNVGGQRREFGLRGLGKVQK